MALAGGPAAKAGDRYERWWTVRCLLDVLDGSASYLRIETPGEDSFEFELGRDDGREWHQTKRSTGSGHWTIRSLIGEGVLQHFLEKVSAGDRCWFVSRVAAEGLRVLIEDAKAALTVAEFESSFVGANKDRERDWKRLKDEWGLDSEAARIALTRIEVRTVDEAELRAHARSRLTYLVDGDPQEALDALRAIVEDGIYTRFDATQLWAQLATRGLTERSWEPPNELSTRLATTVTRYLSELEARQIAGKELERTETEQVWQVFTEQRVALVTGLAGSGKSHVLGQVVRRAQDAGWPAVALRLDRSGGAHSADQLGVQMLGLPTSPVTTLAALARQGPSLVVLDQLDAVSTVSGRHPELFAVVAELLAEARGHGEIRVLIGCRQFDLDHDPRLRSLIKRDEAENVHVGDLSDDVVTAVLGQANADAATLPSSTLQFLRVPLHLGLFLELRDEIDGGPAEMTSLTRLYGIYWEHKRDRVRLATEADHWNDVVDCIRVAADEERRLFIPRARVDDWPRQVEAMRSEGVLVGDDKRVAFFHETFFDYVFARRFVGTGQKLQDLLSGPQDLFIRSHIRQILTYEREIDSARYAQDLDSLLKGPSVRSHLRAVVIDLLAQVDDPNEAEWRALAAVLSDSGDPLNARAWKTLRDNPRYFPYAAASQSWKEWFRAEEHVVQSSVWALSGSLGDYPDEVTDLLRSKRNEPEWWRNSQYVLGTGALGTGEAPIRLLIELIEDGAYDDAELPDVIGDPSWAVRNAAKRAPEFAAEVLGAWLRRFSAIAAAAGQSTSLEPATVRPREMRFELEKIATAAPAAFVHHLLPWMLEQMAANQVPDDEPGELIPDNVFGPFFFFGGHEHRALAGQLVDATETALACLAEADVAQVDQVVRLLAESRFGTAAFLLAALYVADARCRAGEAVDWLVETPGVLELGFTDSPYWRSHQVIEAVTPHCSDEELARLEEKLLGFYPEWEMTPAGRKRHGLAQFVLLSGIAEVRRSPEVEKRLAELDRKFGRLDFEPRGVRGGVVPSPVRGDAATHMSDEQWLVAMTKYADDETGWTDSGELIGGSWQLAEALEMETKKGPLRFAALLDRLPDDVALAYPTRIVTGLTDAEIDSVMLFRVCTRARYLRVDDIHLVHLLEARVSDGLSDEMFALVIDIVTAGQETPASASDEDDEVMRVLGSAQGRATALLGLIAFHDPTRVDAVRLILAQTAAHASPMIRVATVQAMLGVLDIDREFALRYFGVATAELPETALTSDFVDRFIHRATLNGNYAAVAPVVARMLAADDPKARSKGVLRAAVASLGDEGLDAEIDTYLADDDASVRAAAVDVFASNVAANVRPKRCQAVLARAFDDTDRSVRSSAVRSFYVMNEANVPLALYRDLFRAFAGSTAVVEEVDMVLRSAEESPHHMPEEVLAVAERFVEMHGRDLGDLRTAAAGVGPTLTRVIVRLYAQHHGEEIRNRCLDIIDKLLELGVHGVETDLDAAHR